MDDTVRREELYLKNAHQVFHQVWEQLERELGKDALRFPKEIIWLGGAPGAGKGTNTPFIMRERSLTDGPIVMSALLSTPEMEQLKAAGNLIGDREVLEILLRELLKPQYESGVVVDGFPRTRAQAEFVRQLFQNMQDLRRQFYDTPLGPRFRRPIFRLAILFVTEQVSIARQLGRGLDIQAHNAEVERTGRGEKLELRATDIDESLARKRYEVFKRETFAALESLRGSFHYHHIDANGQIAEVERNIIRDFAYQSTLELGQDTYDTIRNIPVASDLAVHARQELVRRLDNYRHRHGDLLIQVVRIIESAIVPVLAQQANVGRAIVRLEDHVFEQRLALSILVDVLTERGFFPTVDLIEQFVPVSIDPQTHAVLNTRRRIWAVDIRFQATNIRSRGVTHLG